MKTKITLLIGAVALVTLSFTFARTETPTKKTNQNVSSSSTSAPVGGFVVDEIVK